MIKREIHFPTSKDFRISRILERDVIMNNVDIRYLCIDSFLMVQVRAVSIGLCLTNLPVIKAWFEFEIE